MLRISEEIANKEKAQGLITGDSLGQVSSQTLTNLNTIHQATKIPLFQPLIGTDKEDIINLSEQINTFDISKLPCKEACTMFVSDKVATTSKLADILEIESTLPVKGWIRKSLLSAEIERFELK